MVDLEDYKSELTSNLSDAWAMARANIKKAQAHQKHYYDKNSKSSTLSVGDRVMVRMPHAEKRGSLQDLSTDHTVLSPSHQQMLKSNLSISLTLMQALNRVRLCYQELPSKSWSGTMLRRPRKLNKQPVHTTQLPERTTGPLTRSMTIISVQLKYKNRTILKVRGRTPILGGTNVNTQTIHYNSYALWYTETSLCKLGSFEMLDNVHESCKLCISVGHSYQSHPLSIPCSVLWACTNCWPPAVTQKLKWQHGHVHVGYVLPRALVIYSITLIL